MLFTISPQGLSESAVAAKLVVAEQRFKEPSRSDGTCEATRIYHINCVVGFCPPNVWRLSLLHQTTQAAHTHTSPGGKTCVKSARQTGMRHVSTAKLFMNEDNVGRSVAQTWCFRLSCTFIQAIQRQLLCLVFIVYSRYASIGKIRGAMTGIRHSSVERCVGRTMLTDVHD